MTLPAGIHVLLRDDGSAGEARVWLDATHSSGGLPPAYLRDNALVDHVDRAVRSVSQFLSGRRHTNRVSREEIKVVIYLADDVDVKPYTIPVRSVHVVVIGAQWLFRLAGICDRLTGPLAHRPRSGPAADTGTTEPDPHLSGLLAGDTQVSEADAVRIAGSCWPSPRFVHTEDDLGSWAVFHDLVRLVWFHELAHALCGHIAFARDNLGLMALYESPAAGRREPPPGIEGPGSEVMQCLEMHADEFAVRSSLGEILWGHDPAGLMLALGVDLGDRLLHLNTAFCVFALLWELDEQRSRPAPVAWRERSHPPVALRYDRFRGFQRQSALEYDPHLVTVADVLSFGFLEVLSQAAPAFAGLYGLTPLVVRTPSMDEAEQYEQVLMRLEPAIAENLEVHAFVPAEFLDPA